MSDQVSAEATESKNMLLCDHAIIIDDKPDEALPLLDFCSRRGLPALYIQGLETSPKHFSLPDSTGLVFLDLQLVSPTDPKTIASAACSTLEDVMGNSKYPYLLFIWSKHTDSALEEFKNNLKLSVMTQPFAIIDAMKANYFVLEDDNYRFGEGCAEALEEVIKAAFVDCEPVLALWEWDRLSRQAVSRFTAKITPATDWQDEHWRKKLCATFALAASKEPGALESSEELLKGAFSTFSRAFQGQIQSLLRETNPHSSIQNEECSFEMDNRIYTLSGVDDNGKSYYFDFNRWKCLDQNKQDANFSAVVDQVASLNSCIYLMEVNENSDCKISPGSLSKTNDAFSPDYMQKISKKVFGNSGVIKQESTELFWLELTPQCDYINRKSDEYLFIAAMFVATSEKIQNSNIESVYTTPLMRVDEDSGVFVICFGKRLVLSHDDERCKELIPKFRFAEHIFNDIRFNFVRYLGRIGIPD